VRTARVTEHEQREIENSRANGYTLVTDGADIEDHHVVAMTYTDAKGKPRTRLALKLRPEAAARLAGELPGGEASAAPVLADFSPAKAKGLELLKGLNMQAKNGAEIRADKELVRFNEFKALLGKARADLDGKVELLADPKAAAQTLAALRELEDELGAYFARLGPGDKAEAFRAVDFNAMAGQLLGRPPEPKAGRSATPWERRSGLAYKRASIQAGRVKESTADLLVPGVGHSYVAEVDGTRLAFVPDHEGNAMAARGYVQLDVEGVGADATARALRELERLGVDTERTTAEQRLELYLDRHLYLRSVRDDQLRARWQAIRGTPAERTEGKLALLNQAAGFDVRTSPNWDPEGRRQAFGHGRPHQYRADLKPADVAAFNADHVVFHNPAGLGWSGGSQVLERFKLLVDAGGHLASQMDRIRRGITLTGSSVAADLSTGGGSYVFTRLSARSGHIRQHGAGFILKPELAQRLDAFSYSGDVFGSVSESTQRTSRAVDLEGMRANARNSGNETNFRDSLALFDAVEFIVLDSAGEVAEAVRYMRDQGYTTWPDGRALEAVIITKDRSPYRK